MNAPINEAERVGDAFSEDGMLAARRFTRAAIQQIAGAVRPGMLEEDAVEHAKGVLSDLGLHAKWHPVRVRFGINTTKAMKQPSVPGVVLKENDIFFVDIGPRYRAWEGDGGASFVVGHDLQMKRCARNAEELFHELRAAWKRHNWTGARLYEYARQRARQMGWELNLDLPGHRLSDFPHAALHAGSLAQAAFSPSPMRWVLEIHLRDPARRFGAFFEDLLLEDRFYEPTGAPGDTSPTTPTAMSETKEKEQ
jgi:hypothetical protein